MIYWNFTRNREKQYDMHEIIYRLVDNSEFEEYKKEYGQSIICGLGRVDGGLLALLLIQRKVVKSKKAKCSLAG